MSNNYPVPEILQKITALDMKKVKLAVVDIDGILRGKVISLEKFQAAISKGLGFCDVVFGWDASDQVYENIPFTGLHSGYPDALAMIDLQTFRQVPWENGLPFFLADFRDAKGEDLPVCPRSLLKKIRARALDTGFLPFFAQEFEWFNFQRDGSEGNRTAVKDLQALSEGMFGYSILRASQHSPYFHDLFDLLGKFGVPLEGIHTETGPGVYEAAISYGEVLEAADRAVLFKSGVKEIAYRHGVFPSFMAKFNEKLPGCSGHIHQSLWSGDGKSNLFYDKKTVNHISGLMENYIAGQLYCLPHILPMYAPTVNSYKRLVEGAWAPTTLTWGTDNRTTALRALPTGESSARLETRVVGSDSNPYLAMAACLASGLYGIKNNLKLINPETTGNGYSDKSGGVLPRSLWEATRAMKASGIAEELFGKSFVDHFAATREWEWNQFCKSVTDWELNRYFEII